jgi:uncharacterized LabA/DUF88 family protein
MNPRFAILLDGGFVTKALQRRNGAFPGAGDVVQETARVRGRPELTGQDLLRIYFYDAPPATEVLKNPIDGSNLNLGSGRVFQRSNGLIEALELQADFAVRIGLDIALLALRQLVQTIVVVTGDSDLVPAFKFARREGVRVYLDHMGSPVRRELRVHTDVVF